MLLPNWLRSTLLDGYFVDVIQDKYQGMQLGGRLLPSIMLVCNNCDHLESFSLVALGLMESEEKMVNGDTPEDK